MPHTDLNDEHIYMEQENNTGPEGRSRQFLRGRGAWWPSSVVLISVGYISFSRGGTLLALSGLRYQPRPFPRVAHRWPYSQDISYVHIPYGDVMTEARVGRGLSGSRRGVCTVVRSFAGSQSTQVTVVFRE